MGWTTPTVLTTNAHITAAVWNAQIADNVAFLGNTHDHSGDAGDGSLYALLPQGIILMADAACPSGWTRVSALDGLFVRGAASYGATGGVATHTHTGPSHSDHTMDHGHDGVSHGHNQLDGGNTTTTAGGLNLYAGNIANAGMHAYGISAGSEKLMSSAFAVSVNGAYLYTGAPTPAAGGTGNTSADADLPAYISVIFCRKN